MSFKRRTGQLSGDQRKRAEPVFRSYVDLYFKVVPVTSPHFHRAAEIVGHEDINIRAADALHLAVAEANGATVCTLDYKMHNAANVLEIGSLAP